jgi:hypothetical protein
VVGSSRFSVQASAPLARSHLCINEREKRLRQITRDAEHRELYNVRRLGACIGGVAWKWGKVEKGLNARGTKGGRAIGVGSEPAPGLPPLYSNIPLARPRVIVDGWLASLPKMMPAAFASAASTAWPTGRGKGRQS